MTTRMLATLVVFTEAGPLTLTLFELEDDLLRAVVGEKAYRFPPRSLARFVQALADTQPDPPSSPSPAA